MNRESYREHKINPKHGEFGLLGYDIRNIFLKPYNLIKLIISPKTETSQLENTSNSEETAILN
ncbi:MAG: hypothetical protein WC438_03030 [Candidatus Pacearchaeota archaeon]